MQFTVHFPEGKDSPEELCTIDIPCTPGSAFADLIHKEPDTPIQASMTKKEFSEYIKSLEARVDSVIASNKEHTRTSTTASDWQAKTLNDRYANIATSTRRLSVGLRCNATGDEAPWPAIQELLRSHIVSIQACNKQANQTNDLQTFNEKLLRMKDAAKQTANYSKNFGMYPQPHADLPPLDDGYSEEKREAMMDAYYSGILSQDWAFRTTIK